MQWVPPLIYLLCVATSAVCAVLLMRSYLRYRVRLLLWSAACFGFLALANLVLFVDIFVFTKIDLVAVRTLLSLAGITILIYAFIWEVD
jgi:hypothetical protein